MAELDEATLLGFIAEAVDDDARIEVRDKSEPNGIRAKCHHNRDGLGRVFSSLGCFISLGNDDITVDTN